MRQRMNFVHLAHTLVILSLIVGSVFLAIHAGTKDFGNQTIFRSNAAAARAQLAFAMQERVFSVDFPFVSSKTSVAPLSIFVVNTAADTNDGNCLAVGVGNGCSLREAIIAANSNADVSSITFDIGAGTPTITVTSALPGIDLPVTIDGSTGGATRVEINGNGVSANGLFVDGSDNTIRRLVINRFVGRGIILNSSNNNIIEGNFIGTNAGGTMVAGFGNSTEGIEILSSQNNLIGGSVGTTPGGSCTGACNLISGNGANGIYFNQGGVGSNSNVVEGNFIGTDVTGTLARGNSRGIRTFNTAQSNRIGGTTPAARNVISGNASEGIGIFGGGTQFTMIMGNFIGTNSAGNARLANTHGVRFVTGTQNITIGGTTAGAGNVISGNSTAGIYGGITGGTIQGNFIGTDLTGTLDIGNGFGNPNLEAVGGVCLLSGSSGNAVGGTTAGAQNVIAYNFGAGVRLGSINSTSAAAAGNPIRGNSIYLNDGLGISLSNGTNRLTTPLLNDSGDADTGANNRQNYPILTSVSESAGTVTVQGTLNSLASTVFAVEIFASQTSDSSGNGEGTSYVATQTVTTNGSGNASFTISFAVIPGKSFFTATATNVTTNDTSELSNAILVANPGTFVFSSATYEVEEDTPGFATITVNRVNGSAGVASVNYSTSNGSAIAGSDYTTSAGTLNFVGGETSRTFIVPITNDTTAEPTETINLSLSNPTGGTLGTPGTAVLTILEDEPLQSFEVNSSADTNDGACTANAGGCTLREALRLRHRHQLRRQLRLPRRPRPQRQRRRRD